VDVATADARSRPAAERPAAAPEEEDSRSWARRGPPRGGTPPDILYHATSERRVRKLQARGALEVRGGRPVYLSRHEGQAWHVAHRQVEDPLVLYVDVSRAQRDGCRFERNGQGLWQTEAVPLRHVLNLRPGFAEQVSAGGIPVFFGPEGPELALIKVQRRSGITWEVAKGKLEQGESPVVAAAREIQEEMGRELPLRPIETLGYIRYGFQTPDGQPRLKTLHMYLFSTPERLTDWAPPAREGVMEVGWFAPELAARLVTHRSLRPLMRRVCQLLLG
jgi:8-oxo-dGTP pyrophosphatase MutT (NUDIX family)